MYNIKKAAAVLLACTMLAGCAGKNTDNNIGSGQSAEAEDHTGYISTLTPANDYYGYINAKELMNMTLDDKHDRMGTLEEVNDLVDKQLDEIIDEIAASDETFPMGSSEQLIHDMYHLVKDEYDGKLDTDAKDTEIIDGIVNRIDSVQDVDGLKQLWRDLALEYGVFAFVRFKSDMNLTNTQENIIGLGFESPGDLEKIKKSDLGAVSVRDVLADELKKSGVSADDATDRATDIIYTLYEIAGHSDLELASGEKEYEDSYNIISASEFSEISHNLSMDDLMYIAGHTGETPEAIVILDPNQFRTIDSLVDEEHLQVWKDIAAIKVFSQYSGWLPEKYDYSGNKNVSGDIMARSMVKLQYQHYLGELYAERYYTEEKRETITKICEEMKAEYYVLINGADWLTEDGKAFLREKLDNMRFFIGADEPHEPDPAEGELIKSSVLETLISIKAYNIKKNIASVSEMPTRNGFDTMAACTVNACYMASYNCINITAAITNYPIYDENADYYVNLGRIGSTIGHEISHAFDDSGVKFDAYGNLRPEAMPEADRKAFEEKQEKAIEYYEKFKVLGSHVNGKHTLGENFADISGLQCALAIAATPENKKTVFENYAACWKTLLTDILAKDLLENDEHSPVSVRVNAVVACFDEFYDIYGVKEGDPMYIAPEERIRRW